MKLKTLGTQSYLKAGGKIGGGCVARTGVRTKHWKLESQSFSHTATEPVRGRDCGWKGRCWSHRENTVPSRDSAHGRERRRRITAPLFASRDSYWLSKASILFRDLPSGDMERAGSGSESKKANDWSLASIVFKTSNSST